MKKTIYILIFGILVSCQSKKDMTERVIHLSDVELIGKYEFSGFNSGVSIELKRNGEFTYENQHWGCTGGGHVQRIRGEFEVNEDKLTLYPVSLINILYLGFDTKNFQIDSVKYHSSDSTYIKKEYQIVKWDSLRYLLSEEYYSHLGYGDDENDFEGFAGYYNSGYEPKSSGSYFVKRKRGYSPKSKFDKSTIPQKYRSRFLEQPIIAEIIEVKEGKKSEEYSKERKIYKLNKGRKDGVMERMDFYGDDGCCTIRITEVEEGVSFGNIHLCFDYQAECGTGERVTTYLEREKGKIENAR